MRKRTAGMFQPQSTPLDIFSAYGAAPAQNGFDFSSPGSGFAMNGGGPIVFDNPTFAAAGDFRSLQANTAENHHVHNHLRRTTFGAPRNTMESMYDDELAAQQAAARDYAPNLEGPLVGEKKSCLAITEEYAKSDPIYIAKTAALPQTYSHYRPVQGDGNCGWRAVAFTYFETLQRIGSKAKLQGELARITSLNNLIQTVGGFNPYVFEDFVEETQNLLKDLADSIHLPPTNLILDRLNNPETSNSIVYHLRLLACSWLRANPHVYSGFIDDGLSVDGYCEQRLQVVNTEIDYTGMMLLIDVLLKPIDIAVEIVYLDRSEGSEVNAHRFEAIDNSGQPLVPESPTIYLLYKPGHYDILYKDPPTQDLAMHLKEQAVINDASNNQDLQVHRVSSFSQPAFRPTASDFAVSGLDSLLTIPGFAPAPTHHGLQIFSPTPISNFSENPAFFVKNEPLSTSYVPTEPTLSPHPTSLPLHNLAQPHTDLSLTNLTNPNLPMGSPTEQKFRPSEYQYKADYTNSSSSSATSRAALGPSEDDSHQTLSTSMFKNSHYNTAHFNNPNFQPEEWCPPEDGSLDDDD